MTAKKFLVVFEYAPDLTRWLLDDAAFADMVTVFCNSAADSQTEGRKPRVLVLQTDPNHVLVDADALIRLQEKAGVE